MAHAWGSINLEDINSEKSYSKKKAYAQSKLANVLFTHSLAKKLEGMYYTLICAAMFRPVILFSLSRKLANVVQYFPLKASIDCLVTASFFTDMCLCRHGCDCLLSPSWSCSDGFVASSEPP